MRALLAIAGQHHLPHALKGRFMTKKTTLLRGSSLPMSRIPVTEDPKPGQVPVGVDVAADAPTPPSLAATAAKLLDWKHLTMIRIDPKNQAIAKIRKKVGKDATRLVAEIVRAKEVQAHQLISIGDTALIVAAAVSVEEGTHAWRIRGCEDTAGIGLLFGKGDGGGMIDCPVDIDWVKRRIKWIDPETHEEFNARAFTTADAISVPIAAALLAAIDHGPMTEGDTTWWVRDDARELAAAMISHGVTDEASGGQRLTILGKRVMQILEHRQAGDAATAKSVA
jgi:hypothetical protein